MKVLLVLMLVACSDYPSLTAKHAMIAADPETCGDWYMCHGCARVAYLDVACNEHEFLTAAYSCQSELDPCKASAGYTLSGAPIWCCWAIK